MPILLEPESGDAAASPAGWASRNAGRIREIVADAGVALVRGLPVGDPQTFRAVCEAIEPNLRPYTGGDSPRTGVADKVYTSTEYDASLEVLLHNELSYAGWSPALVFFGCMSPSLTGGETHIADGRAIRRRMPPDIRARFEDRGIIYLQHLWDADGARWLDLYGGHCVALAGHCHPRLVAAVQEQAGRLLFYSNVAYSDVRALAAERVAALAPEGLRRVSLREFVKAARFDAAIAPVTTQKVAAE